VILSNILRGSNTKVGSVTRCCHWFNGGVKRDSATFRLVKSFTAGSEDVHSDSGNLPSPYPYEAEMRDSVECYETLPRELQWNQDHQHSRF
jgi:hypothetical protein